MKNRAILLSHQEFVEFLFGRMDIFNPRLLTLCDVASNNLDGSFVFIFGEQLRNLDLGEILFCIAKKVVCRTIHTSQAWGENVNLDESIW